MRFRALSCFCLLVVIAAVPATAQIRVARVSGAPGSFDAVTTASYNKAGTLGFVTNPATGMVRKFRPETGEFTGDPLTLQGPLGPASLSPDERTLAVVGIATQKIYLIDTETLGQKTLLQAAYPAETRLQSAFTVRNTILFSPDSTEFFIADPANNAVAVFRTIGGVYERLLYGIGANPGAIYPVPSLVPAKEPDGRYIAVLSLGDGASDSQIVAILDTYTLSMQDRTDMSTLARVRFQPFNNIQFSVSSGWRYLFIPAYDSDRLVIYDMKSYGMRTVAPGGTSSAGPAKIAMSPTGAMMALVNAKSKDVTLFSAPEAGYYASITAPGLDVSTSSLPVFSSDGFTIYIPSLSGEIYVYSLRDPKNPVLTSRIMTSQGSTVLQRVGDGANIALISSLETASNGISQIAINPRTMYLPHLAQYGKEYSGLAIANFGTASANVTFVARNNAGELLAGTTNPQMFTIQAGQQVSAIAAQLFGLNSNQSLEGSIESYTTSPDLSLLYMSGNVTQTQLDGFTLGSKSLVSEQPSQYLGFSRVTEGVAKFGTTTSTEIVLENPGNNAASRVEVSLYSRTPEGVAVRVGYTVKQIPPHGRVRGTLTELFQLPYFANDRSYIEVRADVALKGLEIVKIGDSVAMIPATVLGLEEVKFTAPQFASGGLKYGAAFFSSIAMSNSATTDIQVEIKVVDKDGLLIPKGAKPFTKTLASHESLAGTADELLGFPNPLIDPERYEGMLIITTDIKGLVVDLLIGDAQEGRYLTSEPLNLKEGTKFGLTHFAQGNFGFPPQAIYTGIALLNLSDRIPANVILEAFSPDGKAIGRAVVVLARGERFAKTIAQPELFPNITQQGAGTIRITSDQPILTWEVFGNPDFLVAVTPVMFAP
jgi:hypothetical protein